MQYLPINECVNSGCHMLTDLLLLSVKCVDIAGLPQLAHPTDGS